LRHVRRDAARRAALSVTSDPWTIQEQSPVTSLRYLKTTDQKQKGTKRNLKMQQYVTVKE